MKLSLMLLICCLSTCGVPALAGGHGPYEGTGKAHTPTGSYGFVDDTPITMDGAEYTYPSVINSADFYYIKIVPAEKHFADVRFQNQLVSRYLVSNMVTLTYEGLKIRTHVDAGPGDAPDTLTVYPPPGYYTIPKNITLGEGELGVIEIHRQVMF